MNHAIFSGIPVLAIGLALSVELKVAVAMIGHEEQLFRWVWCRKTPASEIQGRTPAWDFWKKISGIRFPPEISGKNQVGISGKTWYF